MTTLFRIDVSRLARRRRMSFVLRSVRGRGERANVATATAITSSKLFDDALNEKRRLGSCAELGE